MSAKLFLGAGVVSALAPVAAAVSGVPVPQNAPDWLPWVLVVVGPALTALGALGIRAAVAMFKSLAKKLRSDKDKSNDVFADVLDAAAEGLESAKEKK